MERNTIKLMLAVAVVGGGIALSLNALFVVGFVKNANFQFSSVRSYQPQYNGYAPRNNSSAWCPNAKCSNSALCQPCRQRFLFILSTGRAASTTLLDMINHLPNVRLGGENNNALYFLSLLETQIGELGYINLLSRSKMRAVPHNKAWFHEEIPEQATACTFQKLLHTINPPSAEIQQQIISSGSGMGGITLDDYETSQIIGAKMIRLPLGKWTAWEASEFFKYYFPCAKYIINTRSNTDKQLASQTKVGWKGGSNITHENDFLRRFAQYMSEDAARSIYMEEWTTNVTKFNELVEWLGFQNCHCDNVLHNNKNRYQGDETPVDFGVDCRAP